MGLLARAQLKSAGMFELLLYAFVSATPYAVGNVKNVRGMCSLTTGSVSQGRKEHEGGVSVREKGVDSEGTPMDLLILAFPERRCHPPSAGA